MDNVSEIPTLLTLYRSFLTRQGLTPGEADRLGFQVLTSEQATTVLGIRARYPNPGVMMPYSGDAEYFRVRMLGDIPVGWAKYMAPRGSGVAPIYCPVSRFDWEDIAADPKQFVVVTEGEIKSYIACREGPPTVGLGGVEMQTHLFDSGWEWKGRRVAICFDHDKGQRAGEYKPAVGNALGKLATRLSRAGAQVVVLHVGQAALGSGLSLGEKWGLDDYLRAVDPVEGWKKLLASVSAPPEWSEDLADLLEQCVFVTGTNHTHIFNLENMSRKSLADFYDAHGHRVRRVIGEDGKVKTTPLAKIWYTHADRMEASNYSLDPTRPYGLGDNGLINLWKGFPSFEKVEPDESVWDGWNQFGEGLFGSHWGWVQRWTAHMLRFPEQPTTQALMLVTSVQGIGKSLYGSFLCALTGEHGVEQFPGRLFSQFNALYESKVFVQVDELDSKFNHKESELNELISSRYVTIEQKGKDPIQLPNLRRFYFTTNSASPCRLSPGQRRIFVIRPPRIDSDTRGAWGQWIQQVVAPWLKDEAKLGGIRAWFDKVDLEGWNSTKPVVQTEEGREVERDSLESHAKIALLFREWIIEEWPDSPWIALDSTSKIRHSAALAVFRNSVAAMGGHHGEKVVKVEGKVLSFTVYDLSGSMPSTPKITGGLAIDVDPAELKRRWPLAAGELGRLDTLVRGKD